MLNERLKILNLKKLEATASITGIYLLFTNRMLQNLKHLLNYSICPIYHILENLGAKIMKSYNM